MEEISKFFNHPEWRRQHGWRRAIWQAMNRLGLTGMHALPMNRRWVDIHRRPMPIAGLDPTLEGLKIVQISDLHYSPVVWKRYLIQYLAWVNEIEPDVVVVTGDLITGGYRYAHRIATILSHLKAPLGVICTFGNHDYSIYGKSTNGEGTRRADYLEKCLKDRHLIVLRNEVHYLARPGTRRPVAVVGLDDEWSRQIDPDKAWAGVDPTLPIVCLNHNPANALELMAWPWQWMLSGHTHGRQLGTSTLGRRFNRHRFRHYTHGYYAVRGRHLYVNRGLSYGQRVQDWCRPEITVFRLTAQTSAEVQAELVNSETATPPDGREESCPV
jgi:predicted MPP superfamily phosphohydrolase